MSDLRGGTDKTDALPLHQTLDAAAIEAARMARRIAQLEARNYAAILYAITDKRPDMPAEERAELAEHVVKALVSRHRPG